MKLVKKKIEKKKRLQLFQLQPRNLLVPKAGIGN
jgi:hypothetical protein